MVVVVGEDHVLAVLLDRLAPLVTRTTENMEKIRRIAHKINGRVNNTDKNVKAKSLNMLRNTKSERMVDIVKLFEETRDKSTCTNLAAVIHACIAPKSGQNRITILKQLVKQDATKIFIKKFIEMYYTSVRAPDSLSNELFLIIGQLSKRDNKFSKHVESLNATKMFHQHLKNNIKNTKLIAPSIKCFKTLSKHGTIVSVLLKDGFFLTLEKLLRENNKYIKKNKQWVFLVVLANVTKKISEENCDRFVRGGLMQYVLDVFDIKLNPANKVDPKILSSSLDTLVHISNTSNGRTALRKSNIFNILYKFSVQCPEDQIYNSTLSKLCTVINVCQEKLSLPLNSTQSAFFFDLGDIKTGDRDSDKSGCSDSDDSEADDNEVSVIQNLTELSINNNLTVRKSESVKLEISFNYWKDCDELVSMYGRLFEEYNKGNAMPAYSKPINNKLKMGRCVESEPMITTFNKFKSGKYYNTRIEKSILTDDVNTDNNDLKLLANLRKSHTHRATYLNIAKCVNSVTPFVKIAYPEWVGADIDDQPMESLYNFDVRVSSNKLYSSVKRRDSGYLAIYDLDYLLESFGKVFNSAHMSNDDERKLGVKTGFDHLHFESRFESGNLRKVIKIDTYEYDLILNSDVKSSSHNEWFYFQVSNMKAFKPYVFNIVNMEKHNSQYGNGMQPIVFSVRNHVELKSGWRRTGFDIYRYDNYYKSSNKTRGGSYMTVSFTIQFPFDHDICYIAHVYPYTYSTLLFKCFNWKNSVDPTTTIFRANCMCQSLNNNEVPIITITSVETNENAIKDRSVVYLTSRVHSGETSSSWVIDGVIEYLCGVTDVAKKARDAYVFKIVPMLNVEGVINGCHRSGLTNEDLNRKWSSPDPKLHPEIFHARGVLEYMKNVMKTAPYVYCDFHGHSSRKNCFFYGCSAKKSWSKIDLAKCENDTDFMCKYKVERNRETTARITVWRCYDVKKSYTLETSCCGCDEGLYKGYHLGIKQLKEIGSTFCMCLTSLKKETQKRANLPAINRSSTITSGSSSKSMDYADEEQSDSD